MSFKQVMLNKKVLEILEHLPGKSYADKILFLHDQTIEFQTTHITIAFAKLVVFYPELKDILELNKDILIEIFHWKQDASNEAQKKHNIDSAKIGFKRLQKILKNAILESE